MPETEFKGARLVWREEGMDRPGTPVLLAHCSLAHSGLWKPIIAELARTRPVIAPDLPAHGRSDPPPPGASLQNFAAEACAHLAERFHRPIHLVGLSLGGAALARVAWKRPSLAASLTMIEPVLFHLLFMPGDEPAPEPVPQGREALIKAMRDFVGDWGAPGRDPFGDPQRAEALLRCFRLLREDNAWVMSRPQGQIELPDFAALPMPVMLVNGAETQENASAVLDAIQGALPSARRRTIPGAGHLSPVSHWRLVCDELEAFFAEVDSNAHAEAPASI